MNSINRNIFTALVTAVVLSSPLIGQVDQEMQHKRGKLWENVNNDGWIGSYGAWDYFTPQPLGLYPGFPGFIHPVGNEEKAWGAWVNANFHNFESGCFIVAKGIFVPGAPPTYTPIYFDYESYRSGFQEETRGVENVRAPLVLTKNYSENPGFDPRLPEEMIVGTWNTNTSITVTRRSYVWSYPGYSDFIIYDYIFKNTGQMVSTQTGSLAPNYPTQTLNNVMIGFHSGISVSTKSQINFHASGGWKAVAAGGFGWNPPSYHDYYYVENSGELVYSMNRNGGREPLYDIEARSTEPALYAKKDPSDWKARYGEELQSPAAFGWLMLYASPTTPGIPRLTPKPDFLRIDCQQGGYFQGSMFNFEGFPISSKQTYDYATTPDSQVALGNNGDRKNFYTHSYGPYKLALGDSVRIVMAEIAGVMDYAEVNAGDPLGHFPDSSIAAIRRNAANARNAIKWGFGATVNGIPLAADVPEPPPGPNVKGVNVSVGMDTAVISVIWDRLPENVIFRDGANAVFYDGASDLAGYRIYRSEDFQFVADNQPKTFRGATWTLVKDIPYDSVSQYQYVDDGLQKYRFLDRSVRFDVPYGYYVSAYSKGGKSWTSANGTLVPNLPSLESGDYNKTGTVRAFVGPSTTFDIFVVPNPYVFNDPNRSFVNDPFQVVFRNLPKICTIRIYTLVGDLVRVLEHKPDALGNLSGSEAWDQKSTSGLLVAPGLYVYHVESHTPGVNGGKTGKLMLIR